MIKDAVPIKEAAVKTPIVDGSGLKNTLERNVIRYISQNKIIDFENKRVLVVSAMDRFGMAEALEEAGARGCLRRPYFCPWHTKTDKFHPYTAQDCPVYSPGGVPPSL